MSVLYFHAQKLHKAQKQVLWLLNLVFFRIDVLQTLFIVIFLLIFINIIHAIWKHKTKISKSFHHVLNRLNKFPKETDDL